MRLLSSTRFEIRVDLLLDRELLRIWGADVLFIIGQYKSVEILVRIVDELFSGVKSKKIRNVFQFNLWSVPY